VREQLKTLFRCIDCNLIYAKTPFDQTPEYPYSELKNEYSIKEKNDWANFESRHNGHRKEELIILNPTLYSEGAYFDPVRITYLTATNREETLLIKKWRQKIAEPVRYDLVQGRLQVKKSLVIQKDDLLKQLFYEINDPSFTKKAYEFIRIFQEETLYLDPEQEPDETCASNQAQLSYYPLKEEQISKILHKCRAIFTQEDCERIERFIRSNCESNGVMSLVVKKTAKLVRKSCRSRVVKRNNNYMHTPEIAYTLKSK
jgi:hypothetical protein